MTPTLTQSAVEQAVAAFELVCARGGDRGGARLAVDAGVDGAVRLAGPAGDRGDERAPLVAQALAALVGRLARGARGRGGGRRRGEGRKRRGRGRGVGEELQRVARRGRLQHVVVAPRARRQGAERLRRLRALPLLGHRLALRLLRERVIALLLHLRRKLLESRVGGEEEVAHLDPVAPTGRPPD